MSYEPENYEELTKVCPYCKKEFKTYVPIKVFCCVSHTSDYRNLVRNNLKGLHKQNPWRRKIYKEYHGMELTREEKDAEFQDRFD